MKAADHSVLQVLGPPKKLELQTGDIAHNAGLSRQWTSQRLAELVKHGLVEKIKQEGSNPRYRITELGQQYLAGEVDPEDLEDA